ncbi:protein-tyrosine phosphatase-like protein [Circinella umbellata]|nr:protein-tyrosine phosphatase-like protein [Circinella umbellata]
MDIDPVTIHSQVDLGINEIPIDLQPSTRINSDVPPTDKVVTSTVEDDETDKTIAPSVIDDNIQQKQEHQGKLFTATASITANDMTETDQSTQFDIPKEYLTNILDYQQPQEQTQQKVIIYGITAGQFASIQHLYAATPLPNDILFPWLHGVNGRSYQQNLFFGVRKSIVPKHRGITIIHADEACPYNARLTQAVLPSELITTAPISPISPSDPMTTMTTPTFINTCDMDHTINLRNFKIQVSRYGSISDIIIYGYGAMEVAQKVALAQQRLRKERLEQLEHIRKTNGKSAIKDANDLSYRVLVITDPFTVIEDKYPDLVSYDSNGTSMNTISFWEREREEMRFMSGATEITPNVWVGNTQDAPASVRQSDLDDEESEIDDNPQQFSICIEAHDFADMPLPSTLTLARETLNELPSDRLPPEIIHLDVHSTGIPMEPDAFDKFYNHLIHLLAFVDDQATRGRKILIHCSDGYTETSLMVLSWIMYKEKVRLPEAYLMLQRKRNFFVYAADVATLQRIEQQLLHPPPSQQTDHKRKREEEYEGHLMDVANDDDQVEEENCVRVSKEVEDEEHLQLKDLKIGNNDNEVIMNDQRNPHQQETKEEEGEWMNDDENMQMKDNRLLHDDQYINNISNQAQCEGLLPSNNNDTPPVTGRVIRASSDIYNPKDNDNNTDNCMKNGGNNINNNDKNTKNEDEKQGGDGEGDGIDEKIPVHLFAPELDTAEKIYFPWFYSPRFEGSFPSRILPFLYLGNLNHATNPDMLKALGITHVVSVGEDANLDQSQFKLLFLDNLYDDGIDSIRGRLEETMGFVDEAHAQNSHCLIHCRVGVSRSAAITICYVMHHLKYTLVQAYLYVRARRLNVIIQPNLKFMYEMLQLEQHLIGKATISWPILSKEIHLLNMSYRES